MTQKSKPIDATEKHLLVQRARLVDVNYPDRSATTILAGGSGE
jgi:hypothetical protein